jgi:glycosyltransferase involved in cell wall biosynthesis
MVAGRGEGLGELKKQVRNLGIQDRVKFLGLVTDIPAFLSEIDVFTLPTRAETFGIAVIEAMSAEKPVVVYDVGGLPEVVVNGESGFLVPLGDTGQFSQRLNELACDAALRQRIGVMACKHVAESFTIDMMTEQVLRVYESVDHPGNGR